MRRKHLVTAAGGALLALALVGGVAYATIPGPDNVYRACMLKGVGTIRLIDKSLPPTNLMSHCTDKETEISWNQAGQPGPPGPQGIQGEPGAPGSPGTDGKDGQSVTTAPEPPGTNCADGGAAFSAANGTSYACDGAPGASGKDGTNGTDGVSPSVAQLASGDKHCPGGGAALTDAQGYTAYVCNGTNGTDGQPFSGTFTSPNGQFSITVADSGVTIAGPTNSVKLLASGELDVRGGHLDVRADGQLSLKAGSQFGLQAGSQLDLNGSSIGLNCPQVGCLGAARQTDPVANNMILGSSGSVFIGP